MTARERCLECALTFCCARASLPVGHNSSSSVKTSAAKSNENKSKKTPGFSCGGKAPAIIMIIVTFITSVVIVSLAIAGPVLSMMGQTNHHSASHPRLLPMFARQVLPP